MNWSIIDPTTTIKLWTADGTNWYGGRFKSFWLKKNALECAENFKAGFLYVDLINEWTGKRIRLKDNPDRIAPPMVILERREECTVQSVKPEP